MFTPNGKFVAQFGSKGSGPGMLNRPRGVTIDTDGSGLVYRVLGQSFLCITATSFLLKNSGEL